MEYFLIQKNLMIFLNDRNFLKYYHLILLIIVFLLDLHYDFSLLLGDHLLEVLILLVLMHREQIVHDLLKLLMMKLLMMKYYYFLILQFLRQLVIDVFLDYLMHYKHYFHHLLYHQEYHQQYNQMKKLLYVLNDHVNQDTELFLNHFQSVILLLIV